MKKILALVIAGLMAVSICACSDKDKNTSKGESSTEGSDSKISVTSEAPKIKEIQILVVSGDGVNIRSSTDTDNEPIAVADSGDAFKLLKQNVEDGWHEVEYRGEKAYISSEFSKIKTVTSDAAKSMIGGSDEDLDDESSEDENDNKKDDGKVTADDLRENEDGEAR